MTPAHGRNDSDSTTAKGRRGEQAAAAYLREHGYRVLEINFRSGLGEVDIIGTRQDTVVFFEVKTWSAIPWGELGYAVTRRKRSRITNAARVYLSTRPKLGRYRVRFDVLLVSPTDGVVRHIENAFA